MLGVSPLSGPRLTVLVLVIRKLMNRPFNLRITVLVEFRLVRVGKKMLSMWLILLPAAAIGNVSNRSKLNIIVRKLSVPLLMTQKLRACGRGVSTIMVIAARFSKSRRSKLLRFLVRMVPP